MFKHFIIFTILFIPVMPIDFLKKFSKISTKMITQEFSKLSTTNSINANEVMSRLTDSHSRSQPISQPTTQKHTCPPIANPPVDETEFEDCAKHAKEAKETHHPDQFKKTPEILKTYGYPFKEYQIVTKDSYILTVYRITGSPKLKDNKSHRTPIFVNHGSIGASDWWFFHPPERNMVFTMADQAYDVWLGNARGSTYSTGHEFLDHNKNLSYWDFSFHEMGIYDLPAVIKTILDETPHRSIFYICFSMGCTEILICLSELPEINSKIRAAFLLAPVAYMGHSSNGLKNLANIVENDKAFNTLNAAFEGRLRGNQDVRRMLKTCGGDLCVPSAAKCGFCDNAFFALNGVNPPQLNRSALPLFFEKAPNAASVKTLAHFSQLIVSCRFQKFEYSPSTNLKLYGSLRPPLYDVKKITSPIYVYHGEQDNLASPVDIHDTFRRFRHGVVKKITLIEDKLFTHMDFATAKDADKLVYKLILNDMEKYIDAT